MPSVRWKSIACTRWVLMPCSRSMVFLTRRKGYVAPNFGSVDLVKHGLPYAKSSTINFPADWAVACRLTYNGRADLGPAKAETLKFSGGIHVLSARHKFLRAQYWIQQHVLCDYQDDGMDLESLTRARSSCGRGTLAPTKSILKWAFRISNPVIRVMDHAEVFLNTAAIHRGPRRLLEHRRSRMLLETFGCHQNV